MKGGPLSIFQQKCNYLLKHLVNTADKTLFYENEYRTMHHLSDSCNSIDTFELNKNVVVFSAVKTFYHRTKSEGFAVRYVVNGVEHYNLNGQAYPVEGGSYLLSNATQEGFIEVDSDRQVCGICLNIMPELLSEVVATMQRPDTAFSDVALGEFFSSAYFLENKYVAQQTQLGKMLSDLQPHLFAQSDFNMEFFYTLSEKIIADQIPIFKQLQAIPSIKSSTRKELYRHVLKGKDFIDATFLMPTTIEKIAREACLSEYHFFRLFKSIFNVSPHQYILKKRLEYAQNILIQDKIAVSVAAYDSGFSDIYTFSKAFKKHFGHAPSTLLKHN